MKREPLAVSFYYHMTHICTAISDGRIYIMQLLENMPDKAIFKKVFVHCNHTLYFWLGRQVGEKCVHIIFFFHENHDFLMKMGQKSFIFQKCKKKKKKFLVGWLKVGR